MGVWDGKAPERWPRGGSLSAVSNTRIEWDARTFVRSTVCSATTMGLRGESRQAAPSLAVTTTHGSTRDQLRFARHKLNRHLETFLEKATDTSSSEASRAFSLEL